VNLDNAILATVGVVLFLLVVVFPIVGIVASG
jgi:hypothetical protein